VERTKSTLIHLSFNLRLLFVYFIAPLLFLSSCKQRELTFADDVAPIIHQHCSKCHHQDGIGPFQLIDFYQVVKRAKYIEKVVSERIMPPWPADPHYSSFAGEMVLRTGEKDTLLRWLSGNRLPGDTTKIIRPVFAYKSFLGEPDKVVEMREPIPLKGDGIDKFFIVKIPFELEKDTFIKAIEFVPGNRKAAHHINGHLIQYNYDKISNIYKGNFYIGTENVEPEEIYSYLDVKHDDGTVPVLSQSVVNYLPGVMPFMYPEGIGGIRVGRKAAFFFKDIHYGPSYRDTFDLSRLNIYFGESRNNRPLREIQMGTLGISDIVPPLVIPANEIKQFSTRYKVKIDLSLLTINPHLHKLGKSFKAHALLPGGDTLHLIHIPRWDFNWQFFYTFKKVQKLPAGTIVVAECMMDNTVNNPHNPNHPPQTISERAGSMRASDEMFQFIMTVMDYRTGDEDIELDKSVPRGTHQPANKITKR
jgi:hypothetical protein